MQHIKHLILSALALNILSCGFLEDKTKGNEAMAATEQDTTAQNAPADGYIVTPHVAHPKFKALSAAFETQEHRFEIDRCEFKYNGKSFFIGDTEEKIIEIFGKPDETFMPTHKKVIYFDYKALHITIKIDYKTKKTLNYSHRFRDYKGKFKLPFDIVLFRKVPYQLDMTLNEFMELSDLQHGSTLKHDTAAFYIINEQICDSKLKTGTGIGSTPNYHSTGVGHVTIRGEFNPESTGPIKNFKIGLK